MRQLGSSVLLYTKLSRWWAELVINPLTWKTDIVTKSMYKMTDKVKSQTKDQTKIAKLL